MLGVMTQMFKDKLKSLLIFLGVSLAFSEMYLLIFPTIKSQADQLNQIIKMYPESVFKAFGVDTATMSFSKIEYFLSTEIFSLIWPILLVIFSIQLANYAFVAEIEDGTIELTLSQPISRLKLFLSRYFGGLFILALFCFGFVGILMPLISLHGFEYTASNFLLIGAIGFLLSWAVYSLGVFFSVVFSQKGTASFATTGILILMYVLNVLSTLKESLQNFQYVSFFHYYASTSLLSKGEVIDYTYPVFSLFSTAFLILAATWFVNRDIAV